MSSSAIAQPMMPVRWSSAQAKLARIALRLLGLGLFLIISCSYDDVFAKLPSSLLGTWQAEKGPRLIRIEPDRIVEFDGRGLIVRRLVHRDGDRLVFRRSGLREDWRASMRGSRLCLECKDNSSTNTYRRLAQLPSQVELEPFPVASAPHPLSSTQIQSTRDEIVRRFDHEQTIMRAMAPQAEIEQERQRNTSYLRHLLSEVGWIDSDRFGQQTSVYTVLLAKHTEDLRLMLTVLPYASTELKKSGKGRTYAILYDAVQLDLGRKQLYGTQVMADENGPFVLPLEDPKNVDRHRAELGLPTLATYIAQVKTNLYKGKQVRIADDH